MHPSGAKKNKLAQAIFSNDGPNLTRPEVTNRPKVTPNIYKVINKKIKGVPIFKIETPKKGIANILKDSDGNILKEDVFEHFCKTDEGQTWTQTGTQAEYQQLDYSRIVPLLVKTIQELEARIATLEG